MVLKLITDWFLLLLKHVLIDWLLTRDVTADLVQLVELVDAGLVGFHDVTRGSQQTPQHIVVAVNHSDVDHTDRRTDRQYDTDKRMDRRYNTDRQTDRRKDGRYNTDRQTCMY